MTVWCCIVSSYNKAPYYSFSLLFTDLEKNRLSPFFGFDLVHGPFFLAFFQKRTHNQTLVLSRQTIHFSQRIIHAFILPNRTVTKKSCRLQKTEANDHRHFFNNSSTVNGEKYTAGFFLRFLSLSSSWLTTHAASPVLVIASQPLVLFLQMNVNASLAENDILSLLSSSDVFSKIRESYSFFASQIFSLSSWLECIPNFLYELFAFFSARLQQYASSNLIFFNTQSNRI